jgi:hypothetical protein
VIGEDFIRAASRLRAEGLGTENAAWLLYSLARMTRPDRVLEVGTGYTTPFLLQALADNAVDAAADRLAIADGGDRRGLLVRDVAQRAHHPLLVGMDENENVLLAQIVEELGLRSFFREEIGDFRSLARDLGDELPPFDLVWFDAGGPREYADFLRDCWDLINPEGGMLLLHFTHWEYAFELPKGDGTHLTAHRVMPGMIVNEIKRQLEAAGPRSRFEALSIVEPHKRRQGSVTLVRRLGALSMTRDASIDEEATQLGFEPAELKFQLF